MNQIQDRVSSLFAAVLATTAAATLVACGGSGSDSSGYFAVQGTTASGGAPQTICIDNILFIDPASEKGKTIAETLATHYRLVGSYRSFAGEGDSCRGQFPGVSTLLSVDDYNNRVQPAVVTSQFPLVPPPAPSPSPSPSPSVSPSLPAVPAPNPIIARSCPSAGGTATNGLALYGQLGYSGLPGQALTSGTVLFDPGAVSFDDRSVGSGTTTGSLRVTLWALSYSYSGGSVSGTVVARYPILFTDGTHQLRNGESSDLMAQTLGANTPSRGSYCMVVTLEQYSSRCTSSDGYCISDWSQFGGPANFQ